MPSHAHVRSCRRRVVAGCVVAASVAVALGGIAPAGAAPSDELRQQAAELQDAIEASDLQIGALSQKAQLADAQRQEAEAKLAAAETRIEETRQEIARIRELIRKNGASLYRRTSSGNTVESFEDDVQELNRRKQYSEVIAERDDRLLERLAVSKRDLAEQKDTAQRARDSAAAEGKRLQSVTAKVEKARADQQALLGDVQGELAAAVAAERAAREAAARAELAAQSSAAADAPAGVPSPVGYPDVGPPNGSASQAIAFARGVLGARYSTNPRFGPSYDCSGLTYSAWHAAGVEIPRISGTQWAGLPHIPMSAIQPGDLIFWGPGGSQHVALYIGNGTIIDASSSQGRVVQRGIWGSPTGAARVT